MCHLTSFCNFTKSETCVVLFHGEGHKEAELEPAGSEFCSASAAEAIWGEPCRVSGQTVALEKRD